MFYPLNILLIENKAEILKGLRRTHSRDLDVLVNSAATLSDNQTLSGELAFTGGYNPGVKLLVAGAGNTVTAADSGKIIVFNVAAATLVTLPAPKKGMKFTFITSILATGDHEIQAATNAEGFVGGVTVVSTTAQAPRKIAKEFLAKDESQIDYFLTESVMRC